LSVVKGDDPQDDRRVALGRRLPLVHDPGEEIIVRQVEKLLEGSQFRLVESLETGIDKAPEEEIDLAHAAMPGAEMETSPAKIKTTAPASIPVHSRLDK